MWPQRLPEPLVLWAPLLWRQVRAKPEPVTPPGLPQHSARAWEQRLEPRQPPLRAAWMGRVQEPRRSRPAPALLPEWWLLRREPA